MKMSEKNGPARIDALGQRARHARLGCKMSDYSAALDLLPSLRPTNPDDGCEGMVGLIGQVSTAEARDLEGRVAALGYQAAATYVEYEEDGVRTWVLWVL